MAQAPIKGRARINVTDDVLKLCEIEIQKPKAGETLWGTVEVKELFDTFQSFLLLPDEYTIIGVFFDLPFYTWAIIVESDMLPVPLPDMTLPLLMPKYQRTDDGKVSLIDMQLIN